MAHDKLGSARDTTEKWHTTQLLISLGKCQRSDRKREQIYVFQGSVLLLFQWENKIKVMSMQIFKNKMIFIKNSTESKI